MRGRYTLAFKTGSLAGRTFSLGPGDCVFIGSSPQCTIQISDDPTVHGIHACIYYDEKADRVRLKDMGSAHGTARNGRKLKSATVIRAGDRITIGKFSTFHSSWWNALQASRVTRLSRFVARPTSKKTTQSRRQLYGALAAGIVVVGALLGYLYYPAGRLVSSELALKQSAKPRPSKAERRTARANKRSEAEPNGSIETSQRRFIWDEIVAISQRFGDPPPSAMDPGFVAEVERNIREFTTRGRHLVVLEQKEKYWPLLTRILREKNLPQDLAYIVWVESGFDPTAQSAVGAGGLWQLMPDTAREYGLIVNDDKDERTDPRKSTLAASAYISDLLRMFKSERYLLALASYNTGQFRVKRIQLSTAVLDAERADFWEMRHLLPRETNLYVPRIIAAIIIGRNTQRWSVAH